MGRCVRVAVVDDYEVVVRGVARLLRPFSDRVTVVEVDTSGSVSTPVDVALYDSFAQGEVHTPDVDRVLCDDRAGSVVMYTWNFDPRLVAEAQRRGLAGYLSKGLAAADLVAGIEQVGTGSGFVLAPGGSPMSTRPSRPYPGADAGLTEREAEVIALIAFGHDNSEIAELLFLSADGVKTRIRGAYRKLAVDSRAMAVRWALTHGFLPEPERAG